LDAIGALFAWETERAARRLYLLILNDYGHPTRL
jgi:hypothetical protein